MRGKEVKFLLDGISQLSVWDRLENDLNWGLVPQMSENPFVCVLTKDKNPLLKGRLLCFPEFEIFRDYVMCRRFADYGIFMSLLDFNHYGVTFPLDEKVPPQAFVYEQGYRPTEITDENAGIFKALLYQSYGLLLRQEEDEKLLGSFSGDNALFARKEISETNWMDGPLKMPEKMKPYEEKITLKKDECEKASKLPLMPDEAWEVDFAMFPNFQTQDEKPRFLYVLAAVNAVTKEVMTSVKISVDGKPGGLPRIWEMHASRILAAINKHGRVPGEIRVQSPRMMRFLRPLGMHLPFKIIQHSSLPALADYFTNVISRGG